MEKLDQMDASNTSLSPNPSEQEFIEARESIKV